MRENVLNMVDMHKKVKTLFRAGMGREVFTYLLWRLNFFNASLKTDKDIITHNFAMELIEMVGTKNTKSTINTIVDGIFNLEPED